MGFYDLRPWKYISNIGPHIEVYTVIANSPRFGADLKIVVLLNTNTNKHVLLACTDLGLGALKIIEYYRSRFKIEFLFRDAKQFTGPAHCRAGSKEKLDFHFNLSMAAVNMANFQIEINPAIISMNTFKRIAYNTRFVGFLFKQLSPFAKVDINSPIVQQAVQLGRMWPKSYSKAA